MRPTTIIAALIAVLCTATLVYTQNATAQPAPGSQPTAAKPVVVPISPMPIVAEQPKLAAAPTIQAPLADPGIKGAWKQVKEGFKSKHYRKGIGFLLTILIFLWRRFLFGFVMHRLSPKAVGWVTITFSFLATLPSQLCADQFAWGDFIWDGLVASGEAMLLWQAVLKHIPGFKIPESTSATPAVPDGAATPAPTPPPPMPPPPAVVSADGPTP